MNTIVIVSLLANDRPGLVQELAAACHQRRARWLNTKVSHLDGQLAVLIRLSAPEEEMAGIRGVFTGRSDLVATFNAPLCPVGEGSQDLTLRVDANDRAGIVNDITRLLDAQGVQLVSMESHSLGVSGVAQNIFTAELKLKLPEGIAPGDLAAELEALGDNLVVRSPAVTA